jgi:hypothetical protein
MQKNTKIIAVLTEEGDLNIHAFDINNIKLTMEEDIDESEALEALLSRSYRLCSIQWQEIKRINFITEK